MLASTRTGMKLENSFEVPAAPEVAWELLMDVPRVVPCMPGAELTETLDHEHWKATMRVKLGPVSLTFDTDVRREEADEGARRATLSARAREARGRGAAQATIASALSSANGGTKVDIVTDLTLSGTVAQYGRGLVEDVSSQLVARFADCLKAQIDANPGQAQAAVTAQARPVRGLRLVLAAVVRALSRIFRRKERRGP
jgi:carbon monoxide dehydrogenase subunit G